MPKNTGLGSQTERSGVSVGRFVEARRRGGRFEARDSEYEARAERDYYAAVDRENYARWADDETTGGTAE